MEKSARNYRPKNGIYDIHGLNDEGIRVESPALLIIELPDSMVLRIMSRSVFVAMFLLALPALCSIIDASSGNHLSKPDFDSPGDNGLDALPLILRDLLDEGLIEKGQNGLILGNGIHDVEDDLGFLRDVGIDLLTGANIHTEKVAAHQVFNFVLVTNFQMVQQIDDIVKNHGLVIFTLGNDPSDDLRLLNNYKVMYLRRFERTVVAIRKMRASDNTGKGVFYEKKGLEDVYLEPSPRKVLRKRSILTSRKIKFLSDMLKDSLDKYPRHIFISDDSTSLDWLYKNYPMRDHYFEVYSMDRDRQEEMNLYSWLESKVRYEDYVVMKVESQMVEHMLKNNTLYLVDELFLECNNQWQDGDNRNSSKTTSWQCLELYEKVKDEGIAVHQWQHGM